VAGGADPRVSHFGGTRGRLRIFVRRSSSQCAQQPVTLRERGSRMKTTTLSPLRSSLWLAACICIAATSAAQQTPPAPAAAQQAVPPAGQVAPTGPQSPGAPTGPAGALQAQPAPTGPTASPQALPAAN